ncbi:hypothetical protein AB0L85_30325 [Streptomyces sp. NPDC052051]|uniref:hypothetical protein n=1 Tax=Streptomyces sp. NPDC052051 TaxID=3154649 RepID=UPI0034190250
MALCTKGQVALGGCRLILLEGFAEASELVQQCGGLSAGGYEAAAFCRSLVHGQGIRQPTGAAEGLCCFPCCRVIAVGRRLDGSLAAEAIRRLSGGCCAVAVFPGMGEYPEDREQVTETYRLQAKKKIAALWESIGFQPFRRGVWLLGTALRQPEELMQARRAELRALGTAFQLPSSA